MAMVISGNDDEKRERFPFFFLPFSFLSNANSAGFRINRKDEKNENEKEKKKESSESIGENPGAEPVAAVTSPVTSKSQRLYLFIYLH